MMIRALSINIAGAPLSLNNDTKNWIKKLRTTWIRWMRTAQGAVKHQDTCKCEEDDFWSTQNYHRTPPGEKVENDPKQKFKDEE